VWKRLENVVARRLKLSDDTAVSRVAWPRYWGSVQRRSVAWQAAVQRVVLSIAVRPVIIIYHNNCLPFIASSRIIYRPTRHVYRNKHPLRPTFSSVSPCRLMCRFTQKWQRMQLRNGQFRQYVKMAYDDVITISDFKSLWITASRQAEPVFISQHNSASIL